jgi:hypothetical protein
MIDGRSPSTRATAVFDATPRPLSVLLCDHVHKDPSGRKTLLGLYPSVVAPGFPLAMPPVWLYVCFDGARGRGSLTMRVLSPGGAVLFDAGGEAECADAGSTYELTTPAHGLVFDAPGVYLIEALADGVAFARRELRVVAKAAAGAYPAALSPSAS